MATYQLPEVLGVIGKDQMTQLMDHHIINDAVRCLDDVPVEDHLPLLVTGTPTGLEVADAHPFWRYTDLLGVAVGFVLQAFQGTGAIPVLQILLDS